ncbi:MAG: helix-turn-helix domain-containing protein [Mucilaginibacter sp.]|nr:helix-turn-helix domain-containing protein [Mucilaginibacter sp.]
MKKHHGEIIEHALRRNGYNISDLARELGVNRRTLYNYFKSSILKRYTILHIGKILRHDFSSEFPELFVSEDFEINNEKNVSFNPQLTQIHEESILYKTKYIELLEKYNALLTGLVTTT